MDGIRVPSIPIRTRNAFSDRKLVLSLVFPV